MRFSFLGAAVFFNGFFSMSALDPDRHVKVARARGVRERRFPRRSLTNTSGPPHPDRLPNTARAAVAPGAGLEVTLGIEGLDSELEVKGPRGAKPAGAELLGS